MNLGGYGIISVASHIVGLKLNKMIELSLLGEVEEATNIHDNLMPLVTTLMNSAAAVALSNYPEYFSIVSFLQILLPL